MSDSGVRGTNDDGATVTHDHVTTKDIVVGVVGSPAATSALARAAEQSRDTRVPLRIVHSWQMSASPLGADSPYFRVASAADARARATRWVLDTLGGSAASVRWVLVMVEVPAE